MKRLLSQAGGHDQALQGATVGCDTVAWAHCVHRCSPHHAECVERRKPTTSLRIAKSGDPSKILGGSTHTLGAHILTVRRRWREGLSRERGGPHRDLERPAVGPL